MSDMLRNSKKLDPNLDPSDYLVDYRPSKKSLIQQHFYLKGHSDSDFAFL